MEITTNEQAIKIKLATDLAKIEEVVDEVRRFLKRRDATDDSALILNLRELMNNAMEHGNAQDPEKEVRVELTALEDKRFQLTVADQGEGFDHATLNLSMPDDPDQTRNRGLPLINATSDEIQFNETGNEVTIFMTMAEPTGYNVTDEDGWTVITPQTNVTAASAQEFRTLLLDLLGDKKTKYRFDLAKVKDIDSVALSIFVIFANMAEKELPECSLEVLNASSDIINVFELTRLSRKYTIV